MNDRRMAAVSVFTCSFLFLGSNQFLFDAIDCFGSTFFFLDVSQFGADMIECF